MATHATLPAATFGVQNILLINGQFFL